MQRSFVLTGLLAACAFVPCGLGFAASAETGKSSGIPAEQFKALVADYDSAQKEFSQAYSAAKTELERQQAIETKYPKPDKFTGRFLALAEKNPKDPVAFESLEWVVVNGRYGGDCDKAVSLLRRQYAGNEKIGRVCQSLVYSQSSEADPLLREVMARNPSHEAQGQACFSLACRVKQTSADEADKLFNQVVEKYAEVKHYRGTLADAARSELFELHELAIGKVAPEIAGPDVDGNRFKLSDYRGKVTVIDFWGDW